MAARLTQGWCGHREEPVEDDDDYYDHHEDAGAADDDYGDALYRDLEHFSGEHVDEGVLGNLWPHFLRCVTAVRAREIALRPVEGNEVAARGGSRRPAPSAPTPPAHAAPRQREELMIVPLNTALLTRDARAAPRAGHADALVARWLTRFAHGA